MERVAKVGAEPLDRAFISRKADSSAPTQPSRSLALTHWLSLADNNNNKKNVYADNAIVKLKSSIETSNNELSVSVSWSRTQDGLGKGTLYPDKQARNSKRCLGETWNWNQRWDRAKEWERNEGNSKLLRQKTKLNKPA